MKLGFRAVSRYDLSVSVRVFNRRLPGSFALSGSVSPSGVYHGYVAEPFRAKGGSSRLPQLPSALSAPSTVAPQRLPLVRVHMTANGPQVTGSQLRTPAARSLASGVRNARSDAPRTSLQLVEECARLRAEIDRLRQDNQRLSDENARLRGEAPRSSGGELDDSVQRFRLLELE